ncbi:MAG: uracil-DNA glycosylase [Proteobacteria bacterium]|nr:uracil-DNA glycosylase [Pseudomonadota bacterium]
MTRAILHNDWQPLLEAQFQTPSYLALRAFLIQEYRQHRVHPNMHDIFNALHLTSYAGTRVVILGQDPYHGEKQAHGLSFSVQRPTPPPPSLLNIYRELQSDLGIPPPSHGDLTAWAQQGVLLLNTVLTVRHASANSHRDKGWEAFTDAVIRCVNEKPTPVVFVLWGRSAQNKQTLITNPIHLKLCSAHPSPLSVHSGFLGSRPFSRINAFLTKHGLGAVDWRLEP